MTGHMIRRADTAVGDFASAFDRAPVQLDATYTTPDQAHAMMEPHATIAEWKGEKLTLWTSNQMIDWAVTDMAATLKIPKENLRIGDRVELTGQVPDPFAWLMRASLAVTASWFEGLGNAVIEALACGTPVVSTDCPFGPREILADGQFGTLVPVGDVAAMAAAMQHALAQPVDRARLRARGGQHRAAMAAAEFIRLVDELSPRSKMQAGRP